MNKPPFFSVIVPTHTRAILLRRALESIKSQACPVDVEVIVISDASDRATDEVCAELLGKSDMYIRRNGEKGPSASRNLGLSLAKGNYILFLDDDDAWRAGPLPDALKEARSRPEWSALGGHYEDSERRKQVAAELARALAADAPHAA